MPASLTRRAFSRLSAGASLAALLVGCSKPPPGPKTIKVGRDVCEHCNMIISELRFAAQIWDGERHRALLFDDFGCAAATFTDAAKVEDPTLKFWVADVNAPGQWLDARAASYRDGHLTPMGYGIAAAQPGLYPLAFKPAFDAAREKAHCTPLAKA